MNREQLKVLGTIPKVLEVLRELAAEVEQLRTLSEQLGFAPKPQQQVQCLPTVFPAPSPQKPLTFAEMDAIALARNQTPQPPGQVVLRTPEREEYEASLRAGAPVPAPSLPHLEEKKRERLAFLAAARLVGDPRRMAKLEQFKKVPGEQVVEEVSSEPIQTMSEAT